MLPLLKSKSPNDGGVRMERVYTRTEDDGDGGLAGQELPPADRVQAYSYGKDTVSLWFILLLR